MDVIDDLENELGISIDTSNPAHAWDMMTCAGIDVSQSKVNGRLSRL